MIHKRTGLPDDSEIVMCTITKIQYSSVFARIDEFENLSGMIHISEIAAGRIRNIRDYVKEGKKVVCKVLRIHKDRGHVDLSLRRVTDSQRRNKVNELKLEQKAESIIEYVAKQNKLDFKKLYNDISEPIIHDYTHIHHGFEEHVAGNFDLNEKLSLDKKILKQLVELVDLRFTPKSIEISGVMKLSSYDSNGLKIVKDTLEKVEGIEGVQISYLGGGKYKFTVEALEYKDAEPILKESTDTAIAYITKHGGTGEFTRNDKKN
jgi:translation initiation factor 2 subunit 1